MNSKSCSINSSTANDGYVGYRLNHSNCTDQLRSNDHRLVFSFGRRSRGRMPLIFLNIISERPIYSRKYEFTSTTGVTRAKAGRTREANRGSVPRAILSAFAWAKE